MEIRWRYRTRRAPSPNRATWQGWGFGADSTEARLAEVQDRLDSGYYGRPEVIDEIAGRILDSGDL